MTELNRASMIDVLNQHGIQATSKWSTKRLTAKYESSEFQATLVKKKMAEGRNQRRNAGRKNEKAKRLAIYNIGRYVTPRYKAKKR